MKVKIFYRTDIEHIEQEINEFLKENKDNVENIYINADSHTYYATIMLKE